MTNERLRAAIPAAGYEPVRLASELGVDPKTVERWISGRVPHRSHRMAAAVKLGKSDGYLWPATYNDSVSQSATQAELVKLYPSRGAVPIELWQSLAKTATASIDILVYAGSFLHDSIPGFAEALVERAGAGVRVRVLLGDPECEAVALRGTEEGIGQSMADRCRLSLRYFRRSMTPGVDVFLHSTTLYASIFRFDHSALINPHIFGVPAGKAPMMHLVRVAGGRLFEQYTASVEEVLRGAKPASNYSCSHVTG